MGRKKTNRYRLISDKFMDFDQKVDPEMAHGKSESEIVQMVLDMNDFRHIKKAYVNGDFEIELLCIREHKLVDVKEK